MRSKIAIVTGGSRGLGKNMALSLAGKGIASQTALGRAGLPDDIGGVIASLLSEDNRLVNVQRIEASCGMFI